MGTTKPLYLDSVSALHAAMNLPKPLHPLVSSFDLERLTDHSGNISSVIPNFYMISYKTWKKGKLKYGQGHYDFDEGSMVFISPNQVISVLDDIKDCASVNLIIHPDFLRNSSLAKKIDNYGFFSYAANEALHLSEREKQKILSVFHDIRQELELPIDEISQDLIISYIDLLLNYSNRFYKRQFITRKPVNNNLVAKFEELLSRYFEKETALMKGLPSVKYFSDELNLSASYLSDMLRNITGLNTQQHIHNKLIEKAKQMLTTSNLTVSEVAYQLGFEQPQSFNKLFKKKTNVSPLEFRQSFN